MTHSKTIHLTRTWFTEHSHSSKEQWQDISTNTVWNWWIPSWLKRLTIVHCCYVNAQQIKFLCILYIAWASIRHNTHYSTATVDFLQRNAIYIQITTASNFVLKRQCTQGIACSEMIILLTVLNPLTQFKASIGGDGIQQSLTQCLCRGVLWQFEHVHAGAGSGQVLVTGARGVDAELGVQLLQGRRGSVSCWIVHLLYYTNIGFREWWGQL